MISISDKNDSLKRLAEAVQQSGKVLSREVATAINATAKQTRSIMAKQVVKELAVKQKSVKEKTKVTRKASPSKLIGGVSLSKSQRLPLKEFGAKQTKSGTAYRISKRSGRQTAAGAFMGPKPGQTAIKLNGHVYRRIGATRLPIQKLYGPSPWGVFIKQDMGKPTTEETQAMLKKQIERRIKYNVFAASQGG